MRTNIFAVWTVFLTVKRASIFFVTLFFTSILAQIYMSSPTIAGEKVIKLGWNDLVPDSLSVDKMEALMAKSAIYKGVDSVFFDPKYFPAVKKYNGKKVSVPGYMVTMDFDAKSVKEFLLVPYIGACVHSPPPPPNQIVYVKMEKGIKPLALNEAITITGILHVKTRKSALANALYVMRGIEINAYDFEADE